MATRRLVRAAALFGLLLSVGCQSWCERHYPCPRQCGAAPQQCCTPCCTPCCCTPTSSYQAPAPQPAPAWNHPQAAPGGGTCSCPP